jgi:hypothetical protein|nr:MAG TPA: hypothetical protein [Caudoviricetes sp.]
MFVIFRNDSEERLINTDQINAIWQDKTSEQPYFRVEYFGGGFGFNSLECNGFTKKLLTINDVRYALSICEKLKKKAEQ